MASSGKKPTQTERVRASLADAIVRGELGPGVPLDEASLADRFKVSRTPVREAIRQLEAIGFAEARPHRGAVVPRFTPERLNEMFAVMAEMEALCAHYAARNITAAERGELQQVHDACREAAERDDIDGYHRLNVAFHDTIYRASHNGFLAEVTVGVRNRVAPFRKVQFQSNGRLAQSLVEHQRIIEAIFRGDADGAARLMREHLQFVRESVDRATEALRDTDAPAAGSAQATGLTLR
jgi:DNA-binding GntR family transcriptional regulator